MTGVNAIELLDADGDLDFDLFLAGSILAQNRLYSNDGSGVFAAVSPNLPPSSDATSDAAAADVDGDGDSDLLLANSLEPERLYLNDGSGVFADAIGQLPVQIDLSTEALLADLDLDGGRDALLANPYGTNRLYPNLARQLAWRGLPRIGKPLALDAYGTPGSLWSLALSSGIASLPLPPFGTLKLAPGSVLVVGAGGLDGAGRASKSSLVPNDSALTGFALHWQAALGIPLQLGNRELTQFAAW
jgi:hypothetical protein